MSTSPPAEPALTEPATPAPAPSGQLGAGETAVVIAAIAAIAAVTVLAVLERPIPAVLTGLAAVACLLLAPDRLGRLLGALTGGRG